MPLLDQNLSSLVLIQMPVKVPVHTAHRPYTDTHVWKLAMPLAVAIIHSSHSCMHLHMRLYGEKALAQDLSAVVVQHGLAASVGTVWAKA